MTDLYTTIWSELDRAALRDRMLHDFAYVSPAERQRQTRIAIGKSCRCNNCDCCHEVARDKALRSKL